MADALHTAYVRAVVDESTERGIQVADLQERDGWTWQAQYPGEPGPRGAIHFGVSAVPQPSEVANWMLISRLIHPEAVPTQEDGPFETADLEVVVRAYAAT